MINATRKVGVIRKERLALAAHVAGFLNITHGYFSKLVKDGVLSRAKAEDGAEISGRYDLRECVHRYIAFLHSRIKGKPPSSAVAYDAVRTARMESEAGISARRLGMMDATLMRTQDVDAEVLEVVLAIRSKMLGFPAWVEPLLDGKPREERIQLSTQYMEEALSDLSRLEDTEKLHGDILGRNRKLQAYAEGFSEDEPEPGEYGGETTPPKPRGRPRKAQ